MSATPALAPAIWGNLGQNSIAATTNALAVIAPRGRL